MRPLKPLRSLGFRPRRLGDSVSYSPEQIERYKSPWERLKKAQEIYANWDSLVREEKVSPEVTLYRIASERSPWGYWTVAVNQPPSSLPTPPLPPTPPNPGGGGGSGGGGNLGIYAGYIDPFGNPQPGRPPGMNYSISFITVSGVPGFPYPTGETFSGSLVVVGPGTGSILTTAPQDGQPLSALIGVVPIWFRHSKFYALDGQFYGVFLGRWRGPLPNPPVFDTNNLYGYLPNVSDPLGVNQGFASPVGILPPLSGGGGGGGGDPNAPSIEPPPLEPSNPPANFSCDCPDWAKIEEIDPNSPYPSRWQRREWVLSEAGCLVNDQGIGCKHTIAVALRLGIPFP